ncbi:MAG: Ig-like domain-containing protein [Verrucomicrobiota bacterium]
MKSARWLLSVLLALTIPVGAWGEDVELDPVDDFYLWSVSNAEGAPLLTPSSADPAGPSVSWVKPSHGDHFQLPDSVSLVAVAMDPNGLLDVVEFLANGELVGTSRVDFCPPCPNPPICPMGPCILPPVGTPLKHQVEWVRPKPGFYELVARAVRADGSVATSPAIGITVGAVDPTSLVWVETVQGRAVEGRVRDDGTRDFISFRVHRQGNTQRNLQVFYHLKGEAIPGADYLAFPGPISFLPGVEAQEVRYEVLEDFLLEGEESLVFVLDPSPTMGPASPYEVDPNRASATGFIEDSGSEIPVVTVQTRLPYALEGDRLNRGEFLLNRTGDLSQALSVNFEVSGTANRGSDYRLVLNPCDDCAAPDQEVSGNTLVFPEGQGSLVIGVFANFDGLPPHAEAFVEDLQFQISSPMIPAVLGARPPYLVGNPDRASVSVIERRNPGGPEVILIQPSEGEILPLGVPNGLRALAVDPKGSIRRVEFLANGALVGVSEITTEEVDVPGRIRVHSASWTVADVAQSGQYVLSAQAGSVVSGLVPVTVEGGSSLLPTVTLATRRTPVQESGDAQSRTGGFVLHRSGGGGLDGALTVFVLASGSAIPGLDYQWNGGPRVDFPGSLPYFGAFQPVVFKPGETEATLEFTALQDGLVEGRETVEVQVVEPPVLALDAAGLPGILPMYLIGVPDKAQADIEDADLKGALVVVSEPGAGSRFHPGDVIPITATAIRPDAGIESIQFLADGQVIGTVNYCCEVCDCAPAPVGRAFTARFAWSSAPAGTHVLTARTVAGPNEFAESAPVTITVEAGEGANLVIVSPTEGAVLPAGVPVTVDTVGVDPSSLVTTVEFFANGEKIGESCFLCVVDGIFPPGTPIHNHLDWTPKAPGSYVLTALGWFSDAAGNLRKVPSSPVTLRVKENSQGARLTLLEPVNGAQVTSGEDVSVTCVGVGREGGITDVALRVDGVSVAESHLSFFRPPGADEEVRHSFVIRLAPGTHRLDVQDLKDPAIQSPPVTVVAVASGARITWVQPVEGAEFAFGKPIELEVQTVDPAGLLFLVEYLADGIKIGESTYDCITCRPAPGATLVQRFTWVGAPVGLHTLVARSQKADGTWVESEPRVISVREIGETPSFVRRVLPTTYAADSPFTVTLIVSPADSVAAYVVEEVPPFARPTFGIPENLPPFWRVVAISDGGVFDSVTGRIKYGPFLDSAPRTLSYQVLPDRVVDVAPFEGVGVADGVRSSITGDRELRGAVQHPADRDPADNALGAGELTRYAAAWKREELWPGGPNPIPLDYVTRAAALWKGGERYSYDPTAGAPPFCWVYGPFPVPGAASAALSPTFAGMAVRTVETRADGTRHVTVRLTPAPGIRAFALEESLAVTGAVLGMTPEGALAPSGRVIRWGPFYGPDRVEVSYDVAAGIPGFVVSGRASFDGQSVAVHERTESGDGESSPRIGMDVLHDGAHQFSMDLSGMPPGKGLVLEMSTDLQHWTLVDTFTQGAGAAFARDVLVLGDAVRFYRAVSR